MKFLKILSGATLFSIALSLSGPGGMDAEAFEACIWGDPNLKSPFVSDTPTTLIVGANKNLPPSVKEVNIFWIDFQGKWQQKPSLPPNSSRSYKTYVGHIWVAMTPLGCQYITAKAPFAYFDVGYYP